MLEGKRRGTWPSIGNAGRGVPLSRFSAEGQLRDIGRAEGRHIQMAEGRGLRKARVTHKLRFTGAGLGFIVVGTEMERMGGGKLGPA